MTIHDLHHYGGMGDLDGGEDKWQRHIVIAIVVALALLLAVTVGLTYAETHGYFQASSSQATPVAPWPEGPP